jgi:hypothetical protein
MKIVYPSCASGMHMPYEFCQIKTPEDFERFKEVYQQDANGTYHYVGKDNCSIVWETVDINYIAGQKIRAAYPEYKQLNILRSGNTVDINKMNTFIDAVRSWANSSNPDPWDGTLDAITP